MCILSVYTLLKVVGYYDVGVLSMSVMGFQQKKCGWDLSSIQVFLDFSNLFNFAKPLIVGQVSKMIVHFVRKAPHLAHYPIMN